jgi:hypothetical protein|tara:strand:+ start:1977 stop:2171 length:195 start_codon:yes stop_codon:yes gene_type:complete
VDEWQEILFYKCKATRKSQTLLKEPVAASPLERITVIRLATLITKTPFHFQSIENRRADIALMR